MNVVHPIARAWISTGGTGARNYDEFADEAEVTAIIEANPDSALAIEMPHRAPASLGKDFIAALPDAARRLSRERADGSYAPVEKVICLYRISEPGRPDDDAYAIVAMVDTDQISSAVTEPGLVIRNEDVFVEKVRERVALAEATGHLLSPVLLLQTGRGAELQQALEAAVGGAGAPAVADIDHQGRTHAIWPLPGGSASAASLLQVAGGAELVVADGNHRSLAAQVGRLPRFLAVITTQASVAIQPYHRLVHDVPIPFGELVSRLQAAGASPVRLTDPPGIPEPGIIELYGLHAGGTGGGCRVTLAGLARPDDDLVDRMDHAVVERVILGDALGLEPGDKRITYVGGDYPPSWLAGEVDSGRADLAILIPAVSIADFVEVNLARRRMPRKSTWFTPKARAGLVLADLAAEGAVS
jgi:uncharacterized protein (DUF1015 family)